MPACPRRCVGYELRLAAAVVPVVMTVVMPVVMAMLRNALMIAVLETLTTAMVEVTGLRGAHRKAECGGNHKCGQCFGEHLSLLGRWVRQMPSPDTAQATRRSGGSEHTYKELHGLQIRNKTRLL